MTSRKLQSIIALLLLLSLTFTTLWPVAAQEADPAKAAPKVEFPVGIPVGAGEAFKAGELLVKFQDGVAASSVTEALDRYNATYLRTLLDGKVQLWQVPEGQELDIAASLAAEPNIEYAEPNYRYYAVNTPNDPDFGKQWGHTLMHSTAAWDVTTGSSSITIAIIDTGIDPSHPDLSGKIVAGYDFYDNDSDPTDTNGHGTHVSGISAAVTNNGVGGAGMDWNARIMPIRVLGTTGSGYTSDIVDGINWAYQHGAKVLNMSLGGPSYSSSMQAAINAAHGAGSLVVAAMGNDNTSTPSYPAAYDNVLAVAAVGPSDTKSSFSNYGSHCDVAAPGGDMSYYHDPAGIYSTMPTYPVYLTTVYSYYENYDYLNGTSQASPYVAGLAALIWAAQPGLTPDEVQTLIEDTADDLGTPGWDQYYGYGRVNAQAALQQAGPPEAPTIAPISNGDGDGSFLVDWNDVATATSYTLQEDDNSGFSSPNNLYIGGNSQFNVSGKGPGFWYYRVKATNDAGDSGWSNVVSVLVKPNAPTLNAISNPGNDGAYTVSWSAATAASGYTLQEDDNTSFSSPTTRYMGPATSYDVTGQRDGTWYYRVRASNGAGNSGWSGTQPVTVNPLPYGPPNLLVINNPDGDGNYLVDWSGVTSATGYILEQSNNVYFVDPIQVYSGAATQLSVADQPSGHWYYRVRATGPSGMGPWGVDRDVIVTTYIFLPEIVRNYAAGGGSNYGLPINEGMEGGIVPPSGWTRIQTNPRQTWGIYSSPPYQNPPKEGSYAATCLYDDQLGNQNEILLSPEFKTSSAQLQFYSFGSLYWCRDNYDNCDLNVWLVVGAWGGGDDIFIRAADSDWAGTWVWSLTSINLTPYLPAGTPVRVAFQYEGLDGAQVGLDAINITE
jgi:thermitase